MLSIVLGSIVDVKKTYFTTSELFENIRARLKSNGDDKHACHKQLENTKW